MTLGGHSLSVYSMMMACCHHRSFPYCKCKKDTKAVFNAAVCFLHIDLTWFRGRTLGAWNSGGEPLQNQGLQMVSTGMDRFGFGQKAGAKTSRGSKHIEYWILVDWFWQALFWTLEFQIKYTAVGTTCPGRNAVCKWDSDIENGWPVENIPEYVPVWLMGSSLGRPKQQHSKLNGSNTTNIATENPPFRIVLPTENEGMFCQLSVDLQIALKLPGWPAQCHLELNPSFIRPHEIGDGPKGRNTLVAYII